MVYEAPSAAAKKVVKTGGAHDSTQHTFDEEEYQQFVLHINSALKEDKDVAHFLPINSQDFSELFNKCQDGLILRYSSNMDNFFFIFIIFFLSISLSAAVSLTD